MTSVLVYTKLDIQSVLDLCPNAFKNNVQAFRVDKGVRIQCVSTKKAIRLKSFFDGALFSAVLCPNSMPTIDGRPWMLDKFKDKGQLFIKDLTREGIEPNPGPIRMSFARYLWAVILRDQIFSVRDVFFFQMVELPEIMMGWAYSI